LAANLIRGFGPEAAAGGPDQDLLDALSDVDLRHKLLDPLSTDGAALARLEAVAEPIDWPLPETAYDDDLLTRARRCEYVCVRRDRRFGNGHTKAKPLEEPHFYRNAAPTSIATIEAPSTLHLPPNSGRLKRQRKQGVQHLQSMEMMSGSASTTSRQPITVAPCA
jgi:hypothetical protein